MTQRLAPNAARKPFERRAATRFAMEQEVRYKLLDGDLIGTGKTVNISSRGLLFRTDRELVPGQRLELSVQWPAKLEDACPLKLVTIGRVVRSAAGLVAVSIERYEFRTQGGRAMAAAGRL